MLNQEDTAETDRKCYSCFFYFVLLLTLVHASYLVVNMIVLPPQKENIIISCVGLIALSALFVTLLRTRYERQLNPTFWVIFLGYCIFVIVSALIAFWPVLHDKPKNEILYRTQFISIIFVTPFVFLLFTGCTRCTGSGFGALPPCCCGNQQRHDDGDRYEEGVPREEGEGGHHE